MDYLTIMEAARHSGKSDKTIRRAIHKGLLAAHFPQPNRCEIAIKDLDAFLRGQVSGQLESLQEQRIAELEGRIQALEAQVQRLLEKPKALGAHRVTSPRERMAGLLPRHLVPLLPFAQMHNVSETTVHGAIDGVAAGQTGKLDATRRCSCRLGPGRERTARVAPTLP